MKNTSYTPHIVPNEFNAYTDITDMKTMTCKQLGGACEVKFQANTFEEIAEMSKKHAMEMFQKGEESHLKAMNEMRKLMNSPEAMQVWFENKKAQFNALDDI